MIGGVPVYYNPYISADRAYLSKDPVLNPNGEPAVIYVRDAEAARLLVDDINRLQASIDNCIERLELRSMGIDPR